MKVLLTGATGFIGSRLLKELVQENYEVIVLKRKNSNTREIEQLLDKCFVYNSDEEDLEAIFLTHKIDAIIHCATMYGRDNQVYDELIKSNLLFPLELLNLAVKYKVELWINTDSFFQKQVYESDDRKIYMEAYVRSKEQFREWGKIYAKQKKISFVSLQLEHVYGENDGEGKFIPFVYNACKKNVDNISLTEGTQVRDFIYVDDVVSAYMTILDKKTVLKSNYRLFEVGTGMNRSIREFVEIIYTSVHSNAILKWGEKEMCEGEIESSVANNSELKYLGWIPSVVTDEDVGYVFENWEKYNL